MTSDESNETGKGQEAAKPRLDTTVMKAFTLFETLAASDVPMGVAAISRAMSLQKSNVHRLLHTLGTLGYVQQDSDTKRYFPTLKAWQIGSVIARRDILRVTARPILLDLHRKTGESVFLSVFSDTDVLYIDAIDAPHSPAHGRLGSNAPAVFPATGKAILAHQRDPAALVDYIISKVPQASGIDREALLEEFVEIRRKGYAVSMGGWRRWSNSVAAPILRINIPPVAAIGVGGTSELLTKKRISQVVDALMSAAAEISEIHMPANTVR